MILLYKWVPGLNFKPRPKHQLKQQAIPQFAQTSGNFPFTRVAYVIATLVTSPDRLIQHNYMCIL